MDRRKVFVYNCYSKKQDNDKRIKLLKKYCKQKEYSLIGIYFDNLNQINNKKHLTKMLDDIKNYNVDLVVVHANDIKELILNTEIIKNNSYEIEIIK